jgi:hypothetical protein
MVKKFQFWGWSFVLSWLLPPDRPNVPCAIVYFAIWFTGMAQWQLNILISLNRFISLMFPNVYKNVSKRGKILQYSGNNIGQVFLARRLIKTFSLTVSL